MAASLVNMANRGSLCFLFGLIFSPFLLTSFSLPFWSEWPYEFCPVLLHNPIFLGFFPAWSSPCRKISLWLLLSLFLWEWDYPLQFNSCNVHSRRKIHFHSRRKYLTCCTLDCSSCFLDWESTPQTSWVTYGPCRSVVMTTIFCFIHSFSPAALYKA